MPVALALLLLSLPLPGQDPPVEFAVPDGADQVASLHIDGGHMLHRFRSQIGCEGLRAVDLAEYRVGRDDTAGVFRELVAAAPEGAERAGLDESAELCAAAWRVADPPAILLLNVRPLADRTSVVFARYTGEALSLVTLPGLDWAAVPGSALPQPVLIAGTGEHGYNDDDIPATEATLWDPSGVIERSDGSVVICDRCNTILRVVSPEGTISTLTPNIETRGIVVAEDDTLFVGRSGGRFVQGILTVDLAGEASQTVELAQPPRSLARGADGTLYVTTWDETVVAVSRLGEMTRLAGLPGEKGSVGDGGPADEALLDTPWGIGCDEAGNVYVAELVEGRVRMIGRDGTIQTLVTIGGACQGLAVSPEGTVYVGGVQGRLFMRPPDGELAPVTRLSHPIRDLNLAPNGDLLICGGNRVYRLVAGELTAH